MTSEMIIRCLVPWLGSKRTLGEDIVTELGAHTHYVEPCCGSMAPLLVKKPSQKETANDLHGDLTNLAYVVQDFAAAVPLYERLCQVVMSEQLLDEARERLVEMTWPSVDEPPATRFLATDEMVDRAYWYFLASWMGRNGTAGCDRTDYQLAVRWTKSGGSPTVRFRNAVRSIPAWHERLQNVVIMRRDFFRFLDRLEDDPGTAIYFDPPYPAETRSSINDEGTASAAGGGGCYLHELSHADSSKDAASLFGSSTWFGDWKKTLEAREKGARVDEHRLAAEILKSYKRARIVVSSYDCERYRQLYAGWTFIDKSRQKHLHAMNGRGRRPKLAPEVLIVNGPSFAETH